MPSGAMPGITKIPLRTNAGEQGPVLGDLGAVRIFHTLAFTRVVPLNRRGTRADKAVLAGIPARGTTAGVRRDFAAAAALACALLAFKARGTDAVVALFRVLAPGRVVAPMPPRHAFIRQALVHGRNDVVQQEALPVGLNGAFDRVPSHALLHVLSLDLEPQLFHVLDCPSDLRHGTPQKFSQDRLSRRVLLELERDVIAVLVDDLTLGRGGGGGTSDVEPEAAAEQKKGQLWQQARPHGTDVRLSGIEAVPVFL